MHSTFGGCGYVGQQVACHEIADGGDVCALVRTVDSVAQLADLGITSRQVDFDQDVPVLALQLTDQVLYWFVPPPSHGDQDQRLARALAAIEPGALPRRIVLVSTTGVYGDCQGEWVNETRPLNPQTARGRRRAHAEQLARRGLAYASGRPSLQAGLWELVAQAREQQIRDGSFGSPAR